jgi:hypothetical protein
MSSSSAPGLTLDPHVQDLTAFAAVKRCSKRVMSSWGYLPLQRSGTARLAPSPPLPAPAAATPTELEATACVLFVAVSAPAAAGVRATDPCIGISSPAAASWTVGLGVPASGVDARAR